MTKSLVKKRKAEVLSAGQRFDLENSIPYLIYRITARLNQDIHVRLGPVGISLPRWRLLASLMSRGSSTVKELATCTVMRHAVVSKVLKEMEEDGLVSRRSSNTDQRAVIVSITEQGGAAFRQALEVDNLHREIALKNLSEDELKSLLELLRRIQKNLNISL